MKPVRTLTRLGAAVLCAAVLVLSACSSGGTSDGTYKFTSAQTIGTLIKAGDRKPVRDFGGSLLDGGTYNLKQDAGKVTVVNFWGAWCPPCQIETPQFGSIYNAYKTKGVTFVGIDIKEASRGKPRAFVKANAIRYPIVYDEVGKVAVQMGNISTQVAPFTVLLDQQHRVAGVYINRLSPADLEPMLNKLIADK